MAPQPHRSQGSGLRERARLRPRRRVVRNGILACSGPLRIRLTTHQTACFRRIVMLSRFTNFDRTLALMDEWRRRMDRAFADSHAPFGPAGTFDDPWSLSEATWPTVNLYDTGPSFLYTAEVPGLTAKEI